MTSKYYRVDMFGEAAEAILYQFSHAGDIGTEQTLDKAIEAAENWKRLSPNLKHYRITEFVTTQTLVHDNRPVKTDMVFHIL